MSCFEVRRARCPWTPPTPAACPLLAAFSPSPSAPHAALPLHARDRRPQGPLVLGGEPAFASRWGFSWAVVRVRDGWELEGNVGAKAIASRQDDARGDEENVSIDTICTLCFSCLHRYYQKHLSVARFGP